MTKEIEAAIAALSGDPALAGALRPDSAVLAWDARAERVLWASSAAASFAERLSGPDGLTVVNFPGRARLAALGGGLAPRAGFRTERLRFSPEEGEAAVELSCRLLTVGREDVLITWFDRELPAGIGAEPGQGAADPDELHTPPFVERIRAQGRRRFIWSVDREGRFTSVSPPLAEMVGPENAALQGLTWAEVVDRWVVDDTGAIGESFDRRLTWSDKTVLWRIADTSYVVPVDLGGMPVFGRGHEFEGFRGFGLCRGNEIRPAPDSPVLLPPPAAEGQQSESENWSIIADEEAEESAVSHAQSGEAEAELAFETIQARVGAQLGGARNVPLRAVPDGDAGGRSASARAGDATGEAQESRPILSVAERGALREIARALGARLESDGAPDQPSGRAPAEVVSISAARPRDPDPIRILDRLPVGILVSRGDTPLFANRFALDLLGYADPGDLRTASRIFAGRPDQQGAMTLLAKGGARLAVDVRLTSVEWGDAPASLLLIQPLAGRAGDENLSRSFELELARRESRIAELHATLEVSGLSVVTIDRSGRILSASGSVERVFGFRENEIAGESFTILISPDSHRAAIALVDGARAEGRAEGGGEVELFGRPRVGNAVPLLARAGLLESVADAPVALVFRDASGSRQAEGELNRARQDAEKAVSRQTEFLARVSHEIRTPLNAIIGFTELMLEERFGPVGNERYKHYLRDIHDSGGHVVSLVNDLLDLAKVTSGRSELVFTSLDLNEIVSASVGLLQPAAARERIVLRTSFASRLPRLIADERSIRQIALNLVSNAVRFTAAGGHVIVSTSVTDRGELVFRVRDTGIGMTPDEVEKALEPFGQVSVTRREDGTGLGLPLSKALVEANRGSFSISSRRGEGTLVEVIFPPARVLAES